MMLRELFIWPIETLETCNQLSLNTICTEILDDSIFGLEIPVYIVGYELAETRCSEHFAYQVRFRVHFVVVA